MCLLDGGGLVECSRGAVGHHGGAGGGCGCGGGGGGAPWRNTCIWVLTSFGFFTSAVVVVGGKRGSLDRALKSVCPRVVVHSSPVFTFSHRLLVERGSARWVVQVRNPKALLRALQGGEGLRALELVALVALEADRAVPAALRFPGELGGKPVAMCGN